MKRQSSYSQNIGHVPYNTKIQTCNQLLKIIQGKSIRITDFLFGYTLSEAEIPLNQSICFELAQNFKNLQDLRLDHLLSAQSILHIVMDAIYAKKSMVHSPSKDQFKMFFNTLTQDTQETIMNKNFIEQKWMNKDLLLQQNKQNQLALKKFLQEEKNYNKKKAEEADSQGWECQICCCDIQKDDIGILQCGHIFHPGCVHGFLKAKIQSNQTTLRCPMEQCGKTIEVSDIYKFIDGDLRQKYQKFTFNKFMQENNSSTSWCPTAGCQAAFQFDADLDNYKCPACTKHYCLKCRCQYHYGMTCAEYRVNNSFDKNDQQFINFVQGAKFKQCPKCKYWVQRNDGCSTMSCKCGQQFCYDCGGTTCPHGACSKSGVVGAIGAFVRPMPPPGRRPPNFINNIFGRRK